MVGFPTQVQTQPAPAVEGDFCSANPYFTVNAGQGAFVAGASLLTGRFCWADQTFTTITSSGAGPVTGFVGRDQQGLITQFLGEASMQIVQGTQAVAYSGGDFWMLNSGATNVVVGMKAFALLASGLTIFAATGSNPGAASGSASTIAAQTFSVTGSIAVNSNPGGTSQNQTGNDSFGVLTVTAVSSGTIVPGAAITGTGIQAGTTVGNQLTGTSGGIGTYLVNIPQTVASTTVSGTWGLLTVGGTVVAGFALGSVLSGTNVTAGSTITANASNGSGLTGAGGAGTYATQTQTTASTAISGSTAIETKWYAESNGAPGERIRTSSHPLG